MRNEFVERTTGGQDVAASTRECGIARPDPGSSPRWRALPVTAHERTSPREFSRRTSSWLARGARADLRCRALGRRLHRRAGEGARDWLRLRSAAALFGLRFRLCLRRGLVREDAGLVLAGEQPLELVLVDRLALDED